MATSKCFVPGCTSGYKSCTTKFSLFKPPKSPSKLAAWSRAISRADKALTENCKICEIHFESRLIDRAFKTVVDGQVISIDRDRPRLADDAVPTIFPNSPKYLTKTVGQRCGKRTRSASLDSVLQNGRKEKRRRQQQVPENLQGMSATKECNSQSSRSDTSGPKARVVIQQCRYAKLLVKPGTENTPDIYVQINRGVVIFVCFLQGSSSETVQTLAKTVLGVRLSETDDGRLVSVLDLPGDVLIVPQATLSGRIKGTVTQYHKNINKTVGEQLYNDFVGAVQGIFDASTATVEQGCSVHKGTYGNRQVLSVETNGPFTHVIEI